MKNKFFLLFFPLFVGCATGPFAEGPMTGPQRTVRDESISMAKESEGPKKRILVLPFLDETEIGPRELRDEARLDLVRDLNRTRRVIAVDSRELNLDLSKSLQQGEYDLKALAKPAQQLGVHAILEGKLLDLKVKKSADPVGIFRQMKSRFDARVRVRVFTSRSAREVFNTVKTVTLEDANVRVSEGTNSNAYLAANPGLLENLIKEAFLEFTPQIVAALDKLSWEGRIAMIQGDRIFLNVGQISGVEKGDLLKVSEEGEEIFDPQTGNFIGKSPGRMKGTLEVISYFGKDGSIAVIHSGSGFKESDRVELY